MELVRETRCKCGDWTEVARIGSSVGAYEHGNKTDSIEAGEYK
jgi:hypothetical protein